MTDNWMRELVRLCYCCESCQSLGVGQQPPRFGVEQTDGPYIKRTLAVRILEADRVDASKDTHCVLQLSTASSRTFPYAVTKTQYRTSAPAWNEDFVLDNIQHDVLSLRVTLQSQGTTLVRSAPIGSVTVNLGMAGELSEQGEWHSLDDARGDAVATTIKIAVVVHTQHVLALDDYAALRALITANFAQIAQCAARTLTNAEEGGEGRLFEALHDIAMCSGGELLVLSLFSDIAAAEVASAAGHRNTLFRQNTVSMAMLERLVRKHAREYLEAILVPIVRTIAQENLSCEIDPSRLPHGDNLQENRKRFSEYLAHVFDGIVSSPVTWHPLLRALMARVSKVAEATFNEKEASLRALSY